MSRKAGRTVMAMACVFILGAGLVWAGPNMKPGKWEITTTTEIPGMGPQAFTHAQCITEEDAVPMDKEQSKDCEVREMKVSGNTVSWKIVCKGEGGTTEGSGKITYSGDTMNGTMETYVPENNMRIKSTMKGKRLGACDGTATTAPKRSKSGKGNVIEETATSDKTQAGIDEAGKAVGNFFKKFK
ncbi:DUF3617 domain-containing protein [Desulfosudis oleivorans]|uniref:DUF3617 family protein n=1 Tax=Desulfosudis oleivorans (strain DSM 6200 / JCM 39069 / Hxd3) TaxID=96561 RepID=A8ZV09_DESOH|nr:DUF3617 family protein [Desulfosudis oleivorans]ABW68099.1 hypothetical protein Dole_2295 [Desulfosudis oleivorans Hxd3]